VQQFCKPSGYVISTEKSLHSEPRTVQQNFKKITNACNLEKVTFHTLRHTFATRCVEVGFDVKSLSEILGHSDVKTTLSRYVHSSFELKQKNMAKLSLAVSA
jgi:site-specific recombinase XerD